MMKGIKEMEKLNLLKNKSKAGFVIVKEPLVDKFKYWFNYNSTWIKKWLLMLNKPFRYLNSEISLLLPQLKLKQALFDTLIWLSEAMLEGLIANFATHFLFGVRFSISTVLAHGIIIKQGISIYHTLRKNDSAK